MRGHVRKRSTWEYVIDVGQHQAQRCKSCDARHWLGRKPLEACPKCGGELTMRTERRQRTQTGFGTRKAAQEALTAVLHSTQVGTYITPQKLTLGEFLKSEWLPAIDGTIRPSTLVAYTGHVEKHITPALGTVSIQKLTGGRVNAFYGSLSVKKPDGPGLKPATVRRVHATLHRALRDAVRWGHVPRNAADQADPPRQAASGQAMKVWTLPELQAFLDGREDDRLAPLWTLLLTTGMRRGEALGLRWSDIDLDAAVIAITQARVCVGYDVQVSPPKTRRGRRPVDIDPATVAVLKTWRKRQREERIQWGRLWTDTGLVFTQESGTGWHPDRITKLFGNAVAGVQKLQKEEAERSHETDPKVLPRIRLHDLRHTHATVALASGEHPKVVSERLGHATVGMTLDTYSHVVPGLQKDAAARIGALVFGARCQTVDKTGTE